MTLKEFTDMAQSCNSPITVMLFSDIESEEEFRLNKNAGLVLLKFQSIYEPAVVLTSKFVNARVEAFYGVSKDTYHVIVEIDDLQQDFLQRMPSSRKYIEKEYICTGYRDTDVVDYLI